MNQVTDAALPMDDATPPSGLGREGRLVIALVGLAHSCSHFFMLVLPPLFPFLVADFAVSYTELGLVMSVYFAASGIGQPISGVLVDRYGARVVLFVGLLAYALLIFSLAFLPAFWMFYPVMLLAGLGNSVFHPADYTVLSASVPSRYMGRAFSIHTLGGNLGWVAAPVFVLGIAGLWDWRAALAAAGLLGLGIWLALWFNRHLLKDEKQTSPAAGAGTPTSIDNRVLFSSTVLLCFTYFALLAAALIGVQNFIGPILETIHDVSLAVAGAALTGYLLGASTGVLFGGVAADRTSQHAWVIVTGLGASAACIVLVAYVPSFEALLIVLLFGAGFLSGMTSPSRDMLVRKVTPKGATGRVFGVVYSGLDVGSAVAPASLGYLLDHDLPEAALWAIGVTLLIGILTVTGIREKARVAESAPAAG